MRARLPKLGRTARWILTIGIILIPVIVLAVTYSQNLAEESRLKEDIDTASAQLSSRFQIWQQRLVERSETQEDLQDDVDEIATEVNGTQKYVWTNITGTVEELSGVHLLLGGVISDLDDIDWQFDDVILPQLDQNVTEQFPYNETQSIEIGEELFRAADDANVNISSYTCSLPSERTIDGVKYQVFTISLSVEGQVPNLLEFLSSWPLSQRFPCDFKSVSINMPEEEGGDASMTFNLEIYCYG